MCPPDPLKLLSNKKHKAKVKGDLVSRILFTTCLSYSTLGTLYLRRLAHVPQLRQQNSTYGNPGTVVLSPQKEYCPYNLQVSVGQRLINHLPKSRSEVFVGQRRLSHPHIDLVGSFYF